MSEQSFVLVDSGIPERNNRLLFCYCRFCNLNSLTYLKVNTRQGKTQGFRVITFMSGDRRCRCNSRTRRAAGVSRDYRQFKPRKHNHRIGAVRRGTKGPCVLCRRGTESPLCQLLLIVITYNFSAQTIPDGLEEERQTLTIPYGTVSEQISNINIYCV